MAARSKHVPSKRKRAAARPAQASMSASGPFFRFYHSEALREKTLTLLGAIEQARDPARYKESLSDLVMELTKCGMDAYFLQPLRLAKPGLVVEQSASFGLAGIQELMGSVVHQIIGHMDDAQMRSVCRSIRQFML